MTMARTRVGIVEWARRARGAHDVELEVADALAGVVVRSAEIGARLSLVRRARRHAWCAEQWAAVVPVLHDAAPDGVAVLDDPVIRGAIAQLRDAPEAHRALEAEARVTDGLVSVWERWAEEAAAIADAPYAGALRRVLGESRSGEAV
jgi:hypothetical protein